MSDVNTLNLKCPFDPNQYNIGDNNITVPDGTSAWALSLVYLGKQVHRSGWNAPIEHMRLAHKSEVGNTDDGVAYIEKSDKNGYWSRWIPTQEDLLACDWKQIESLCPEDCMLSFDLNVGVESDPNDPGVCSHDRYGGYMSDDMVADGWGRYGVKAFGTLTELQSQVGIKQVRFFSWDKCNNIIYILVSSSNNQEGYQKMEKLFEKELTVTIDGIPYHLGSGTGSLDLIGRGKYDYNRGYDNTEAQTLSTLLQQSVGKTLHFCFNWK